MKKIGIIGAFGFKSMDHGGQPVKTRNVYDELCRYYKKDDILIFDTLDKRNIVSMIINAIHIFLKCKNVIFLPAQKGLKVLAPLFSLLNLIRNRTLHYVVIGGWLIQIIEKNRWLVPFLKRIDFIYCESNMMVDSLKTMGVLHGVYMPNFKRMKVLEEQNLIFNNEIPLKLCTFSRVSREKGIEDAVDAVIEINEKLSKVVYTLDIYGKPDDSYTEKFEDLVKKFPQYIRYCGMAAPEDAVDILKAYNMLLFPTFYEGEGMAGTLIDSFFAGVPVIATDWHFNKEIVEHNVTGIIYKREFGLVNILMECMEKTDVINDMKKNCLDEARKYLPEIAIKCLLSRLA